MQMKANNFKLRFQKMDLSQSSSVAKWGARQGTETAKH